MIWVLNFLIIILLIYVSNKIFDLDIKLGQNVFDFMKIIKVNKSEIYDLRREVRQLKEQAKNLEQNSKMYDVLLRSYFSENSMKWVAYDCIEPYGEFIDDSISHVTIRFKDYLVFSEIDPQRLYDIFVCLGNIYKQDINVYIVTNEQEKQHIGELRNVLRDAKIKLYLSKLNERPSSCDPKDVWRNFLEYISYGNWEIVRLSKNTTMESYNDDNHTYVVKISDREPILKYAIEDKFKELYGDEYSLKLVYYSELDEIRK